MRVHRAREALLNQSGSCVFFLYTSKCWERELDGHWGPRGALARHGGHLLIAQPLHVLQHKCLPLLGRQLRQRRSEEHTSELQSQSNLVCRLLLEKKKKKKNKISI